MKSKRGVMDVTSWFGAQTARKAHLPLTNTGKWRGEKVALRTSGCPVWHM